MTQQYKSRSTWADARVCHQGLSPAAAQFLDYVLESDDHIEQLKHLADDLPTWTRTYPTTQLTWPTLVGPDKLQQIKNAVENVCALVKSLGDRIFKNDPEKISDFYNYGDPALVELLLEPPNGIDSAIGRCDYIDGPAGFKCCEINMAANVGGWESRFWEQKYLTNPVVSRFMSEHGIRLKHHDPLRSLCHHIVANTLAGGVRNDPELNVAVLCSSQSMPGTERTQSAQTTYLDFLKDAHANLNGSVLFCAGDELTVKNECLFHTTKRIHAVINYSRATLQKQVYWCQKAGTICLYNGPLTRMMSDKRNLALLSESEHSSVFNDAERKTIRDHIPWSRIVTASETTYQDQIIFLSDFILAERDRLVLKLGIGLGGKEVHVGRFTPAAEWRQRVQEALSDGGWMVQEYVDCHPYLFADGDGNVEPQNVVWGMFCFGSHYGGGYLRMLPQAARRGVVNSGGGAVEGPIFELMQ